MVTDTLVTDVLSLIAHPRKVATPKYGLLTTPGTSMKTRPGPLAVLLMVKVLLVVARWPDVLVAVACSVWGPLPSRLALMVPLQPTFGQPGTPGLEAHTSARLLPYVAVVKGLPSTSSATLLIADVLLIAQPDAGTLPAKVAPPAGVSM